MVHLTCLTLSAPYKACSSHQSLLFDHRLKEFEELFEYLGEQTCAADGMCQEKCPVKINTGELIKSLRAEDLKNARATNSVSMVGDGVELTL